jgi:hypothetical protein
MGICKKLTVFLPLLFLFYTFNLGAQCLPYDDFKIVKIEEDNWGIKDGYGDWITKEWESLSYSDDNSNWLEAERRYTDNWIRSKIHHSYDDVHEWGVIDICRNQSDGSIVWGWVEQHRKVNHIEEIDVP